MINKRRFFGWGCLIPFICFVCLLLKEFYIHITLDDLKRFGTICAVLFFWGITFLGFCLLYKEIEEMTIFLLDQDPDKCAQMFDDKSLDRQIKTIAQVLCNVCYWSALFGQYTPIPDKYYKKDIPLKLNIKGGLFALSQWARACKANYEFLVRLGLYCCDEYVYRQSLSVQNLASEIYEDYIKRHKYQFVIEWARDNVPDLPLCSHATCKLTSEV